MYDNTVRNAIIFLIAFMIFVMIAGIITELNYDECSALEDCEELYQCAEEKIFYWQAHKRDDYQVCLMEKILGLREVNP